MPLHGVATVRLPYFIFIFVPYFNFIFTIICIATTKVWHFHPFVRYTSACSVLPNRGTRCLLTCVLVAVEPTYSDNHTLPVYPTSRMQRAFCHSSRSVRCSALKDNVAQLPPITGIACIKIPDLDKTIPAIQGKLASVSIYNHLQQKYGKLNKQAALEGLSLYDEVVEDAIQRPGAHPNIDLLFEVRDKNLELEMIVEKQ